MPVIRLSLSRIRSLLGRDLGERDLEKLLMRLKSEVEGYSEGYVEVEVNSDRLDMMISEGIVRSLKGLLGIEVGLPIYRYRDSWIELEVSEVPQRRYIAMAVVRNINNSEGFIEELIQFQEKLHVTIGRRRRKVAIGIHDLSKIDSKICVYRELESDEKLVPLGYGRAMRVDEMIAETEQGRLYGSISIRDGKLPGIICGDKIISVPPVINSELTRVTRSTRDLLIDVTGTDLGYVEKTLEILSTTLAESSSERVIERVSIRAPWGSGATPRGGLRRIIVGRGYISEILDVGGISILDITRSLLSMRLGVGEILGDDVEVIVPPYRIDISGPIDVVEDIAMAMDLNSIEPEPLAAVLPGRPSMATHIRRRLRDIMIGLGFTEVYRHVLVSREVLEILGYNSYLAIKNPVSSEMSAARPSIIPSILDTLKSSQHAPKPVRVFEIGEVVVRDPGVYTGWRTGLYLAAGVLDDSVSFEDIQAPLFSLIRTLGLRPRTASAEYPVFIRGRSAYIYADSHHVGVVGEIRLEMLRRMGIGFPAAVFELDLLRLLEAIKNPKSRRS